MGRLKMKPGNRIVARQGGRGPTDCRRDDVTVMVMLMFCFHQRASPESKRHAAHASDVARSTAQMEKLQAAEELEVAPAMACMWEEEEEGRSACEWKGGRRRGGARSGRSAEGGRERGGAAC